MALKYMTVVNGVPTLKTEANVYDQTVAIGSTITSGTALTALPNGQTYTGDELEVYLNGVPQDLGIDWNTVGSAPRTQISFTKNLYDGDDVRYRINKELSA